MLHLMVSDCWLDDNKLHHVSKWNLGTSWAGERKESSNNVCQRMNNERPVKDAELELILSPGAVGDTPHSTLPATASAATSKKDKSGWMIRPALLSPDMKIFILQISPKRKTEACTDWKCNWQRRDFYKLNKCKCIPILHHQVWGEGVS